MTRDEFNDYCQSLSATTNVVQWGNASVWKIGGKIFAICANWGVDEGPGIGFKCSDLSYQILIEQEGIMPSPYLARAKWVRLATHDAMSDDDIKLYIERAYLIIMSKLTKAKLKELGLEKPKLDL